MHLFRAVHRSMRKEPFVQLWLWRPEESGRVCSLRTVHMRWAVLANFGEAE